MTGVQTCALPICFPVTIGFVNQEGYLVIPDDYEMIQYPFFENGYCIAKKEGKLGIFDRKNYEVFPFIYDQLFGDLSAENPKVVVALNGKWEIMDIHRNTILPLEYDDIFGFNDKYIIASKNNKYGLIDYQENIIIDFKWDHLEFVGENYCAVYRDWETDRKSTRLNSSHRSLSRMPSSA